jgi:hypothetical protein
MYAPLSSDHSCPLGRYGAVLGGKILPNPLHTPDASGVLATYSTNGAIDINNPFFQNLGTNGRTCNACHISSSAWSVTPRDVAEKFKDSDGTDPIFRTNDGSNCPSSDVSTVSARRTAYSQLLNKALIRVSIAVPSNAEFRIVDIQDPYKCPETTATTPALYRRPLANSETALAEFYARRGQAELARACYERLAGLWQRFPESNEYVEMQRAESKRLLASASVH